MNKYGIDKFSFEIIEECDREILDERERYWIKTLNTLEPNGYNILNGGRKLFGAENPFYGKHHSAETKECIKETNIKNGNYEKSSERMKLHNPNDGSLFSRATIMLDDTSDILDVFESATKAGEYIRSKGLSKAKFPSNAITEVCRGTQKTAYGFNWKYFEPTLTCNLNERTYGHIINRNQG